MDYKIIALLGVIILVGLFFLTSGSEVTRAQEVTVYRSPNCGCCGNYISYLKQGGFRVKSVYTEDRSQFGVPREMQSCHTAMIEDYFIEGHVPVKAIDKLLQDGDGLLGIALPGMPQGSPGMPGLKQKFNIYSLGYDQAMDLFVSL